MMGVAVGAQAALPGFRPQLLGPIASGFLSSLAVDSRGTLYYTTTAGKLYRFADGASTLVASVTTQGIDNSGLLGMALRDDATAVVHYTTPNQTEDVISTIDLASGHETILARLVCDISNPGAPAPSEHHGGNPTVAPDGTIYVAIGDYGIGIIATLPGWSGGRVFRIRPDGSISQFATGFRNPFDLAWDPAGQRLIVPDNGVNVDDEINIITEEGHFYGWPWTYGTLPPVGDSVSPLYVFPRVVAPTGVALLDGRNPLLGHGMLLGAFVTKALYWIPDLDVRPLPDPIALLSGETAQIIDVVQARSGDIYFATGSAIYRLEVPQRGDCNGDGMVNAADVDALLRELADGDGESVLAAQQGAFAGTLGCDLNADGVVDTRDLSLLLGELGARTRAVRGTRGGTPAAGASNPSGKP